MPEEIKKIGNYDFIRYHLPVISEKEMIQRSQSHYKWMNQRRSIRDFSEKPIPKKIIENIIKTASTAPSGANKQPWMFCAVNNPVIKKQIRLAAEKEEKENYEHRMSDRWKKDLQHLATNWQKPFLEKAPWLIVVFKKTFDFDHKGVKTNNYYVNESTGLACGFLLQAIYHAGLAALTHTPGPMNFLSDILNRPVNEKPFLLIPVGLPADETYVPHQSRKKPDQVSVFYE